MKVSIQKVNAKLPLNKAEAKFTKTLTIRKSLDRSDLEMMIEIYLLSSQLTKTTILLTMKMT